MKVSLGGINNMKKTFIVEIEYNELPENIEKKAHVLYDTGVEVTIENMMEGYLECNSIESDYEVNVKEYKPIKKRPHPEYFAEPMGDEII
jgi:hypothetical protein